MHIIFFLLLTFNLQLSLLILTLRTPFHAMQTDTFSKKHRTSILSSHSLFSNNSSMANLLWVTDYTCSYFIDSKTFTF